MGLAKAERIASLLGLMHGRISCFKHFSGGYGPEEFLLKTAKPGNYLGQAQFCGHRQQVIAGGRCCN